MQNRQKRATHKFLTKTFGNPLTMSERRRRDILILLGGWLRQHEVPASRIHITNNLRVRDDHGYDSTIDRPQRMFVKHAGLALVASAPPKWHWRINRRILLPKGQELKSLGVPTSGWEPDRYLHCRHGWRWIEKGDGKSLSIVLPVNYHLTVPADIRVLDKKIVQRAWNHRVYSDKETWECTYWDFTKLTKDENSWTYAEWHSGFVVKMSAGIAVERTLARALTMATQRTVRAGVQSILSDNNAEG